MNALAAGATGLLFALGLGLSRMTDPARVVGFLDVAGAWDPSLTFVMAGAVGTHALLRRAVLRRERPVLAPSFPTFGALRADARLVSGAALFGVGWGLAGYCPGPAFTSLAAGNAVVPLFVAAMMGGMFLVQAWDRALRPSTPRFSS
ncbi:MAG: DUF6691 family protein [Anaeromyxobacteraceae bacterium]